MNTLDKKALSNLNVLYKLNEKDELISQHGKLIIKDEYDQVDNLIDIEYAIYFTFYQIMTMDHYKLLCETDIIKKMDICLDNIYENEKLLSFTDNEDFSDVLTTIDGKVEELKESYFYQSPFFSVYRNYYNVLHRVKEIFKENNIYINKLLGVMNKDFHREHYIESKDSDSSDNDDDNGDDNSSDDGGGNDDSVTGEENPNLIYEEK